MTTPPRSSSKQPTPLAVIRDALSAATPGPWEVRAEREPGATFDWLSIITETENVTGDYLSPGDAHLIANAPAWLAELVERCEAAEATNEQVKLLVSTARVTGEMAGAADERAAAVLFFDRYATGLHFAGRGCDERAVRETLRAFIESRGAHRGEAKQS